MRQVHLILIGLSLTIVLLSINRLTGLTSGYLAPYEFLRWLDFNAMLPIPLVSVLLYYLLKREITYESASAKTSFYTVCVLLLITGIYFFGAGSGDHEVTNYLNSRFCEAGKIKTAICQIISFNDDIFSHYVYYAGFVSMNVALMLLEHIMPRKKKATKNDLLLIIPNSLFIALGIFANLAFEEATIDLIVFSSVMLLALYLLLLAKRKLREVPVTFYFAASYTIGVVSTLLYKILG